MNIFAFSFTKAYPEEVREFAGIIFSLLLGILLIGNVSLLLLESGREFFRSMKSKYLIFKEKRKNEFKKQKTLKKEREQAIKEVKAEILEKGNATLTIGGKKLTQK